RGAGAGRLAGPGRGGEGARGSAIISRGLGAAGRLSEPFPAPPTVPAPEPVPAVPAAALSDLDSYAARMFFTSIEPFFVDDAPEQVHHGRIARAAAGPIWEWICRDLVPEDAKAYADNVTKLLAAGQATNAFAERVVQAIDKPLAG